MIKKVKYWKNQEITRDNVRDIMDEMISKIPYGITHKELFFGISPKIFSFFVSTISELKAENCFSYRGIDFYMPRGTFEMPENSIILGQKKDLFNNL